MESTFYNSLIKIFIVIIIAYVIYATFFYVVQRKIIFPTDYAVPPQGIAESIPENQKIWIEHEFGKTESWYFPPLKNLEKPFPLLIIAHGNADLIDRWTEVIFGLRENGIAVLLVEYPGYGRSEGEPSQESITEVFVSAYDYILKKPEIYKNRVIFLGQSIGGGAICALAEKRNPAAIILISTFRNVGVLTSDFYLPQFLVKDHFDNLSVISKFKGPVLLVHGTEDDLIPFEESEKLLEVSANGKLVPINGGHNLRINWDLFWKDEVIHFLKENNIL